MSGDRIISEVQGAVRDAVAREAYVEAALQYFMALVEQSHAILKAHGVVVEPVRGDTGAAYFAAAARTAERAEAMALVASSDGTRKQITAAAKVIRGVVAFRNTLVSKGGPDPGLTALIGLEIGITAYSAGLERLAVFDDQQWAQAEREKRAAAKKQEAETKKAWEPAALELAALPMYRADPSISDAAIARRIIKLSDEIEKRSTVAPPEYSHLVQRVIPEWRRKGPLGPKLKKA